jgi:hypothetical protein
MQTQKNPIKYEWQEKAQRYASTLGIKLENWESRWFKLFKDNKSENGIEEAYRYLKDHPKSLKSDEKIKLFFKISQKKSEIKQVA